MTTLWYVSLWGFSHPFGLEIRREKKNADQAGHDLHLECHKLLSGVWQFLFPYFLTISGDKIAALIKLQLFLSFSAYFCHFCPDFTLFFLICAHGFSNLCKHLNGKQWVQLHDSSLLRMFLFFQNFVFWIWKQKIFVCKIILKLKYLMNLLLSQNSIGDISVTNRPKLGLFVLVCLSCWGQMVAMNIEISYMFFFFLGEKKQNKQTKQWKARTKTTATTTKM